ncbi:MAG: hypothetical protein LBB10_02155, partial [Bifidobacteriaceae bacterium]|nr:hypothetical protein [Bifidobacteriaceae bacterium]
YIPVSDDYGLKLKVGVKTVNAILPAAYLSYGTAADSLLAKYIISEKVDKGDPLPADTLKFDPNYKDAKVGSLLDVIGVPSDWQLKPGSCKITLSDGTDVTGSIYAKCDDKQISYIPNADDLKKSVTFSGIWTKEHFNDSALSIKSGVIQKGDGVRAPLEITGLLENNMTVYLDGIDLHDWKLSTCKLYKTKAGEADGFIQDCVEQKDRQFRIDSDLVGYSLKLETSYTRDGYNDGSGEYTSSVITPGDYPYPTQLSMISNASSEQGNLIRVNNQVLATGIPDDSTGWKSEINWQLCSANCEDQSAVWTNAGETSQLYMPLVDNLGKFLRVTAHVTKLGYNPTDLYSEPSEILPSTDPVFDPQIVGDLNVNQVLTAVNIPYADGVHWSDISYKWFSKNPGTFVIEELTNFKDRQIIIDKSLLGLQLMVEVTAKNDDQGVITKSSVWTNPVSQGQLPTFRASIIGDPKVNSQLLVQGLPPKETGWDTAEYQWFITVGENPDIYNPIVGQTDPYYRIGPDALGKRVLVRVTLSSSDGSFTPIEDFEYAGTDDSNPKGQLIAKGEPTDFTPTLLGQDSMNSLLSVQGILDPAEYDSTYQWQRCTNACDSSNNWTNILNATESTYRSAKADVGNQVRAEVTATHKTLGDAYDSSVEYTDSKLIKKAGGVQFKPALSGDFVVNSIISAVGFPNSDWKIDQCVWHLYNTQSQLVRTVQGVPTDNINGCRPYIISSLDLGLRAQLTAHAYHITDSDYYEDGTGSSDVSAQIAKANLPDFSLSLATPGKVGSSVVALGVPLTIDGATFEYNWQKQETPTSKPINVSNSSDDFLIITPDFYNYYLALTVKISIPGYNDYYATAQTTSKVALGDSIGFTPSILGLPKIGEQLVPGNLPDPTLGWTLSYSWITDDGKKVSDNRIYEPGVDDVGKNIAVEVKASRTGYADSIVKSENVGPVIGGDSISFTPNIGGLDSEKNAKIGSALQALDMPDISTGWTVNYAWYYFDSAASTYTKIANSDNKDYMPGVSEIDKTIALGATATRPGYIDSVAYSEPAKVVKANFPDYTADFGTDAKVDSALQIKFSPELDTSDANSATYQWYLANDETADGNIISSAITDNYMVPESDQGKYIYAKITLSKPGFNDKVLATSRDFISETIDPTFTPAFLDASNNEFGRILTLDPASLLQSPYEFSHMALYAQVGDTPNPGSDYYISGVVTPSVALDDPFVLGKKVYAKVVMTDPGTKAVVGQTASFGPIVNGEIPDFTPVISNTSPKVDDILSVSGLPAKSSTDSAASPDFEYLYKWMASGDLVSTDSQYKVTGADVGKTITVEVTVLRDCYNSKAAVSAPTSVVLEGAIVDFSPYLVGSFVVGEGAITVDGIVSGYNQAYEVQMCSNPADESTCAALNPQPAFTGNSFALTDNMIGQNIRVKVTLSKQYYEDSVAYTSISGKVHDADALKDFQPTIAGTPKVGDVISAAGQITEVDPITGNPIDYKYTYQWQESSDGVTFTNINGATDINYKIPVAAYAENESGQPSGYLRVQVTVSRDSYADVARFSNFEIVQKGDIPFDANEVKYCSGNLSGDINVVYRVDIPLSVCGLPKNFSDSQFSTDYKWYIADSVDSQAPVLVSSDATYTPIVSDVNKFLITKIHLLADGYNDKEIVVNSGGNKVAKGEAVDLSSATLNNFSPKVADTIRLMGLPQNGWQITYQVYDAQAVSTPLYKCTFTDQAQCRDSFSVTPNMYDKQLSVVIEAKRNGYETSNATLPFTNLVGKGNPIDFSPVIAPRSGENIKVDSVLEIQGVPKVGDTSLPFNDFTVDYSWIDQADHLVSDRAVFTPDPSLAGQDLKCEIIVKSVGFEDSIENCLAVRVDLGNKISLQGAFINGVFQSKHFLTLEGFPDITEGWALDTVIWYSCKNLNDSPDQCNTLSSVVNQFPDYSKNPPSFELTDSQVGMFIKAYIKFTKGGFLDSDAVLSAPNAVAVGAPPYFQPEITNGGKVGDRLVALGAPSEFSGWLPKYQWFANGKVIPNNRGSDFVPTSDYLGKNISVSITIYNPNPGYENMSVTKKSSTVNIGLGSSLTAGVNGYNPKIVYYPGFIYSYYLIHGSQAGSLGWQESVSWRESGRIVPGEINNYWVVDSQQNNVSAVLDLSRPGYKSNQITVHE